VEVRPDITMPDLAAFLEAEHGVTVDPSNLSKFLCREGFTYKKCMARPRSASGFALMA
jgi:transposase